MLNGGVAGNSGRPLRGGRRQNRARAERNGARAWRGRMPRILPEAVRGRKRAKIPLAFRAQITIMGGVNGRMDFGSENAKEKDDGRIAWNRRVDHPEIGGPWLRRDSIFAILREPMIVRSAVRFFAVTLACAAVASFAAGPAPDLAAAFERLAARVSPDDVRRNIAEADDEVWLETAWSALNALEDFSKETGCQPGRGEYHPETAVFAMADGAVWTNGLDYALNGTPREALNLRWFVLLNQLVQKVGHFDGETLDVRLRGEGSHFDEPLVATIWHGLAKAGWWLDWDHRRLVLRISRPAGTPEEEDASAADFAAFLACAHFFHDDPARIPGESEVAERLANLLASSWKRLRANGWTVKPAGFENWRRVPDSDAPPPAIVLKAAMWDDLRCYPSDEEPAIRRSEALEFLSFLRPAQLSALLAGPRDDPRRGFVLRALGLAHAFGCAPEWDGKEWTDAADRFALDDDARREPARALLFQNALFAPYRDEIEAAAAPAR